MANQILTNCGLWVAQYNLAGDANSLSMGIGSELQDTTAIGDAARSRMGGLQTVAFQAEGYWDDPLDAVLFEDVSLSDVPVTIAPAGLNPGDRAFLARCAIAEYMPVSGSVGEMARFSVGGEGTGVPVARGVLLANTTAGATVNGTAQLLGAVAAGQSVYASLHVTAASGTTPTLVVTIQSDDNVGFTSPTTRITFATATAAANLTQFASAAGAITDTYWRAIATITGAGPSFTFTVAAGIR